MNIDSNNIDFRSLMKNQQSINEQIKSQKEQFSDYDFKIVSFKIGQEYYGIDIMHVKEILKEGKFTKVPNTLDFVIGVLNIRGDIIPIIDLAKMFHLDKKEDEVKVKKIGKNDIKSIIVIRVATLLIGIVVEQIQRVIQLRKDDIQPPSPLLGSINERYIRGVSEINNNLYVIFDTDAIFSDKGKSKKDVLPQVSELSEEYFVHFCNQIEEFANIHINDFNKSAFRSFYAKYASENNVTDMPNIEKQVSENVMKKYYSKYTGLLWEQPFVDQFLDAVGPTLKRFCSEEVRVLVLGCAHGHEAFSIYFAFNDYFNEAKISMIAADQNLAAISSASGFEVRKDEIPSWIKRDKYFMKISDNNYKVKKEVSDGVYFEYHNIKNIGYFTREFDIIIARDISLFLSQEEYVKFLKNVTDKIISGGLLIIGDNENITRYEVLSRVSNNNLTLFKRK